MNGAQEVVASMTTFGVALRVGTLPGQAPSDRSGTFDHRNQSVNAIVQ